MSQMISPFSKASLLRQIEQLWEYTNAQPCATPCNACIYFRGAENICRLWNNEVIPPEVLPTGCSSWEFNDQAMPF